MNMTTHTTCTSTRRSSLKDYHQDHYINHNNSNSNSNSNTNNNNNNSSFSSSLLEEIYRSFDETRDKTQYSCYTNNKMRKSNNSYDHSHDHDHSRKARTNRLAAVDQWVENERRIHDRRRINYSSSTSSSDSTSSGTGGYPFTTYSDTEALSYSKQKPPPQPAAVGLRPIRTASDKAETHRKSYSDEILSGKKKKSKDRESNLQKRALKLYGDLKKVRQPISPGGKLASFINSLFTSNNGLKKPKMSSPNGHKMERESIAASTPSTTASRSCLSKTPSSAGRFEKRSVRFVDDVTVKRELSSALADDEEFKVQIREKHRRVEEMAKELLKNYHYNYDSNNNSHSATTTRKELRVNIVPGDTHYVRNYDNTNSKINNANIAIEKNICKFEDEEEDDGSCCSSDLFELENLMEIGVPDRYREELPVYETTHVSTNRAIANGYMLY